MHFPGLIYSLLFVLLASPVSAREEIPYYHPIAESLLEVKASSAFPGFPALETINGSGLRNRSHASHHLGERMWISRPSQTATQASVNTRKGVVWLMYSFKQQQTLDYMEIWNHNQSDHTDRGLQKVYLQYSADGVNWITLKDGKNDYFIIPESAGRKEEPPNFQLRLKGISAKYFVITADSLHGNYYHDDDIRTLETAGRLNQDIHFYGLSEVRFYQLKKASAASLPEVGDFVFSPSQAYVRSDEGPRRECTIVLDQPLYAGGSMKVEINGKTTTEQLAPSLTGITQLTSVFPPGETDEEQSCRITLTTAQGVVSKDCTLPAARMWTVYFLPHSHLDIGYTHAHNEVLALQWQNLERAVELADKTRNYPEGSQFRWNVEATWPLMAYLKKYPQGEKSKRLTDAIRRGQIGVEGALGSILTGLSKQEELTHLSDDAHQLADTYGIDITTAMMSDISGVSWGMVTALAQNGIKYFSLAPNYVPFYPPVGGSRVGNIHREWGDFPFYWESGSGEERILCWSAGRGYSFFHSWLADKLSASGTEPIWQYLTELEKKGYPYEMAYFRYTVYGDNGPPDGEMSDIIREWNEKYASPQFVIGTTHQLFTAFEEKYGEQIPTLGGDMTPFWEDGAASSASELAMNRRSADRLNQAEILWSLTGKKDYPASLFTEGWRNTLLFSEHTWGASASGPQPESEFTRLLWKQKRNFALTADSLSRRVFEEALSATENAVSPYVHVYNTQLWERSDIVHLKSAMDLSDKILMDASGRVSYLQQKDSVTWYFMATDVPPLGSKVYQLMDAADPHPAGAYTLQRDTLSGGSVTLTIDKTTGAISYLAFAGTERNYAGEEGLNRYIYSGRNAQDVATVTAVADISLVHNGPVFATLRVTSGAPGTHSLLQEVTVYQGLQRIDIENIIDKKNVYDYENVRFQFDFNIDNPQLKLDIPFEEVTPERDQLAGANRNFYSVNNGIAIEGMKQGMFLSTIDTPLLEIGAMTGEQWLADPKEFLAWKNSAQQSSTIYSWAMNNSWRTNYKASQSGICRLHYTLLPFDPNERDFRRRGTEISQPLVAALSARQAPVKSLFRLKGNNQIVVSTIRPGKAGHGLVVRLHNTSRQTVHSSMSWNGRRPEHIHEIDNREIFRNAFDDTSFWMKPYETVTLFFAY